MKKPFLTDDELKILSIRIYLQEVLYIKPTYKAISEKHPLKMSETSIKQHVMRMKYKLNIEGNIADIIKEVKDLGIEIPEFKELCQLFQ